MEFRIIAFLTLAGLIVLDAIITYYTFRKTEREIEELSARLNMTNTHTTSLNDAWLGVEGDIRKNVEHIAEIKRDIGRIRGEIRTDSGHINSRFKSLEKQNASKTESVSNSAPRTNSNKNNHNKKNKH